MASSAIRSLSRTPIRDEKPVLSEVERTGIQDVLSELQCVGPRLDALFLRFSKA